MKTTMEDKTVVQIEESCDLVATKHEQDESGFSVFVMDKNSDFTAWMDVWFSDGVWKLNWNKYIFDTRSYVDVRQSELQDSPILFDEVASVAMEYLQVNKFIPEGSY